MAPDQTACHNPVSDRLLDSFIQIFLQQDVDDLKYWEET